MMNKESLILNWRKISLNWGTKDAGPNKEAYMCLHVQTTPEMRTPPLIQTLQVVPMVSIGRFHCIQFSWLELQWKWCNDIPKPDITKVVPEILSNRDRQPNYVIIIIITIFVPKFTKINISSQTSLWSVYQIKLIYVGSDRSL